MQFYFQTVHYGEMLKMREEKVTINILNWLENSSWTIICFDFPQSGTGILLHPNKFENFPSKNKGGIIPDIIAVKDNIALFFENKDRFVLSDFNKINEIKNNRLFENSIEKLIEPIIISKIYYGIGIPTIEKEIKKSLENCDKIDFLISTDTAGHVQIHYDDSKIF
jgi:hypothetical protein